MWGNRDYFNLASKVNGSEELCELQMEEVAGLILASWPEKKSHYTVNNVMFGLYPGMMNRSAYIDYTDEEEQAVERFLLGHKSQVQVAIYEAWAWMEGQALIIWPDANNRSSGYRVISRRGMKFKDQSNYTAFANTTFLRKEALHPDMPIVVWQTFTRGSFDTAVFEAAKKVEISLKEKSGCSGTAVQMSRSALHKETGILTDNEIEDGEKDAMSALFAGFFGTYRNSTGHRNTDFGAEEAAEIIVFASHLLRVLDRLYAKSQNRENEQ